MKMMKRGSRQTLLPEAERLRWLQGKLLVPHLLDYRKVEDREILWMSAISGTHAADPTWEERLPDMVSAIAKGLKTVHSLDITNCPFDCRNSVRIEEARLHLENGWVDEADFDENRQGCSAAELFEQLQRTVPSNEDLVFTHGDYCLPNILLDQKMNCGFIDWGRAGVADCYQDIALAVRSLTSDFGEQWGDLFMECYGIDDADWNKMEFYQLLDEFF